MSEDNRKVHINIEVQANSEAKIREIIKEINQADTKLTKMINAGVGTSSDKANKFLTKTGVFQTGAANTEEQALEDAVNESVTDLLEEEVKPGGKFDLAKLFGITGANTDSVRAIKDMMLDPKSVGMRVARAMPYAALIFLAIEIGKLVYQKLTSRNNIFDLTFRRWIREEIIKMRSRELRQQVRVGERQIIFVSEAGETHPKQVVNTLELVRNREIFELDVFRVRKGYQF